MARLMCVATHHKAGTVWMRRVFKVISLRIGVPWIGLWSSRDLTKLPETGRHFLFNWHGHFPPAIWQRDDVAFFHMIRDPRDVLISGAQYHLDAPEAGEKWLHTPRADLGGVSYQTYLRALPDYADRLRFEMTQKHAETLAEMTAWPWGDARAFEARYETLINPRHVRVFRKALRHLGLDEAETEIGMRAFWTHSVFGRLFDTPMTTDRVRAHIRSAAPRRFSKEMPRRVGEEYSTRFNADLVNLGYAASADWVRDLPEDVNTDELGKDDES